MPQAPTKPRGRCEDALKLRPSGGATEAKSAITIVSTLSNEPEASLDLRGLATLLRRDLELSTTTGNSQTIEESIRRLGSLTAFT